MQTEISCNCEEWQNSARQIFSAQINYTLITGVKYTGSVCKYCPFCGRLLTKRAVELATAAPKLEVVHKKSSGKRKGLA